MWKEHLWLHILIFYRKIPTPSFDVSNKLHNTSGLTNVTSSFHNIYEQNNTVYIVSSYVEGESLYNAGINTLSNAVRIAININQKIRRKSLWLHVKCSFRLRERKLISHLWNSLRIFVRFFQNHKLSRKNHLCFGV